MFDFGVSALFRDETCLAGYFVFCPDAPMIYVYLTDDVFISVTRPYRDIVLGYKNMVSKENLTLLTRSQLETIDEVASCIATKIKKEDLFNDLVGIIEFAKEAYDRALVDVGVGMEVDSEILDKLVRRINSSV